MTDCDFKIGIEVMKEKVVIWWIKKDFRLHDNPALLHCLDSGLKVLPIFFFEPSSIEAPETSSRHVHSWITAARDLYKSLQRRGGKLSVVYDEVINGLEIISQSYQIEELVSHEEIGFKRTFQRDLDVRVWCEMNSTKMTELPQTGVIRRLQNRDDRSKYWKAWFYDKEATIDFDKLIYCDALSIVPNLKILGVINLTLDSLGFQKFKNVSPSVQSVSETDAFKDLESFLYERGVAYSGGISSPNTAFVAGSRLSVHLAWGTLSPRHLISRVGWRMDELLFSDEPGAGLWRRSLNSFKGRISWRDHFIQRLETEPEMESQPMNKIFENLEFNESPQTLKAWLTGQTGFPLVDACIRCAKQTGFLNFRMRSMITSVACHALGLDWKKINFPMSSWWTDLEPGIQISQLQMQAGMAGINTLRTYNPGKQIADHDPEAKFIKTWVPELRSADPKVIVDHQTEKTRAYIKPIVDWRESVSEFRSKYYSLKSTTEGKAASAEVYQRHGSRKGPVTKRKARAAKKES